MKERPILFSAPMVRALLAGTKTQTRRVVKPQPETQHDGEPYWYVGGYRAWGYRSPSAVPLRAGGNPLPCPYGQPGDRLWVRETWGRDEADNGGDRHWRRLVYRADPGAQPLDNGTPVPWKPSIHMPRWASRITLELTGVRVERLNDISEDDAWAEGISASPVATYEVGDGIALYRSLWESINGPDSWQVNPWVWVVEFRRL